MITDAEVAFASRNLISTLDKKETVATLRTWRQDSTSPVEVDLLTEFIHLIDSGELDG